MLGLHRRNEQNKMSLPRVAQKETIRGACTVKGVLVYPADKEGSIINEEAGYHHFELLSGETPNGELAVAVLGVLGASKNLLTASFDRPVGPVGHRYHELEVQGGQLIARNGAIEYDLGSWPPEELTV